MASSSDLFEAAEHIAGEQRAMAAVRRARTQLLLGTSPEAAFFSTITLPLALHIDWTRETMSTDGRGLYFNPDFVNAQNPPQLVGLLVHESLHIMCEHFARIADVIARGVPEQVWQLAADFAINPMARDSGYVLPEDGAWAAAYNLPDGRTFEWYVSELLKQGSTPPGGPASGPGGVHQPTGPDGRPDPALAQQLAGDVRVRVLQAAAAAKARGTMRGAMASGLDAQIEPPIAWEYELADALVDVARDDFSWAHPSRHGIALGMHLPGMHSQSLGPLVVAMDFSGSMSADERATCWGVLAQLIERSPRKVWALHHSSEVALPVEEWNPYDPPPTTQARASGGTDHVPVFAWCAELEEPPAAIVCITDMGTRWPDLPPDCPVIIVATTDDDGPAWARIVRVTP